LNHKSNPPGIPLRFHHHRNRSNAYKRHGLEAALCAVARSEAAIIKIEAMQASARHLAEFETRLAKRLRLVAWGVNVEKPPI
jgi:hypothetical protein